MCDGEKRKGRPVISAPVGDVQYPPIPSHYDPSLPPPIFDGTHAPYQPGRKFDSFGEDFKPKYIGLPHRHPLRPRITSSLYSRPSDGGETYAQQAHPKRPASSVYSRPTDGSPYASRRSVGLPSGYSSGYTSAYASQVGSMSSESTDPLRELRDLIKAANDCQAGRLPPSFPAQ
ncbi:MAG: hypothetical protein L6R41_004819 [Letrouitia leprolyta]|nr:MAG: hypothetical protein L6R41_004819 [Letrouitia leprolyta]